MGYVSQGGQAYHMAASGLTKCVVPHHHCLPARPAQAYDSFLWSYVPQAHKVAAQIADGAEVPRTPAFLFYSSWVRRLEVAIGTAAGLEYMHDNGCVHQDLTSYNLLLDHGRPNSWVVKVGRKRKGWVGQGRVNLTLGATTPVV